MAIIKKAQQGKTVVKTKDSTNYFTGRMLDNMSTSDRVTGDVKKQFVKQYIKDAKDVTRQSKKGKPGYDKNGFPLKKKNGGAVKAKDGNWIQKAINPKHKGYCTPMTKPTCTPRRKALAQTLRKIAKKK